VGMLNDLAIALNDDAEGDGEAREATQTDYNSF